MSVNLPTINLAGLVAGATGTVLLPQPKVLVGELAHLRLYNESGSGLTIKFNNGHEETIPAGAWPMLEIEPEVVQFVWTVTYVLPNAPVTLVSMVYYFPYEGVPPTPALGNSPIGVTGGVSTTSNALSNEGAGDGTEIIDLGTESNNKMLDIFNDHFIWSVEQADIAHQVLKGQTAGNPLQIGQAGDTTEVLGISLFDQAIQPALVGTTIAGSVTGSIVFTPAVWGVGLKILFVDLINYNNASSATFIFPSTLTHFWFFGPTLSTFKIDFFNGASAVTVAALTALGGSSAGTSTVITDVLSNTIGRGATSVIDRMTVGATTSAIDSGMLIIGR